jgi:hypothetical protein
LKVELGNPERPAVPPNWLLTSPNLVSVTVEELTGPLLTNPPWFLTGDTPQPTVGDLVKVPR